MEPDRPETPEADNAGQQEPVAPAAPAAPLSMLDAVGRLSPDQAGLIGVLLGLHRLSDDPPEKAVKGDAPEL
ncbi:hypothetical protein [Streptacidiphilus fuscans]|uniref:Uncharacterized protein n=1 Tax=Streptacidiphilus fuscans TaxID=2789292 RepID=A0A931FEP5_9ACTN|nr:hypothetical protein [Streptacidiphilus fuscans]MBF9068886.1 hypothetical protein [Streptacidiphilus fuscans]MBF9073340.1 hypothetical protein [Streptacidiphilus fuscans]